MVSAMPRKIVVSWLTSLFSEKLYSQEAVPSGPRYSSVLAPVSAMFLAFEAQVVLKLLSECAREKMRSAVARESVVLC